MNVLIAQRFLSFEQLCRQGRYQEYVQTGVHLSPLPLSKLPGHRIHLGSPRMPSRRKINLGAIRASLNLICPKCQGEITPAQILRITFEEIKCPHCDSIVKPQRKELPKESY
ncbi:MAG TPA: hypothetical protein VKB49_01620 [Candidatus Sulfotelmatobacter sp.]|nr:hypothetical protein [Candidatus Sulfotelmatobacter sp.]